MPIKLKIKYFFPKKGEGHAIKIYTSNNPQAYKILK